MSTARRVVVCVSLAALFAVVVFGAITTSGSGEYSAAGVNDYVGAQNTRCHYKVKEGKRWLLRDEAEEQLNEKDEEFIFSEILCDESEKDHFSDSPASSASSSLSAVTSVDNLNAVSSSSSGQPKSESVGSISSGESPTEDKAGAGKGGSPIPDVVNSDKSSADHNVKETEDKNGDVQRDEHKNKNTEEPRSTAPSPTEKNISFYSSGGNTTSDAAGADIILPVQGSLVFICLLSQLIGPQLFTVCLCGL